MNDEQRIRRLSDTLLGTGATVDGPFQVWGLDTTVTDSHLFELADWADLIHLMLFGCPITDESLGAICRFPRLESLDIGGTRITSGGIAQFDLPTSILDLGLSGIYLTDQAVNCIASLPRLRALNCNGSGLSLSGFSRLVAVAGLSAIEALGCPIPDNYAKEVSRLTPGVLMNLDSGLWRAGEVNRRGSPNV